jgi:hypothetical protein
MRDGQLLAYCIQRNRARSQWAGEVTKALLGAVTQGFKMVIAAAA